MSWHRPERQQLPSGRFSGGPSSSTPRAAATPARDLFPPSQQSRDQEETGHQKRPAPRGRAAGQERDAEEVQKRRRLLLAMDDWTGAKAQKPLAIRFPRADPNAPAWGWSSDANADADDNKRLRPVSRPGSGTYSVKKPSPVSLVQPSSSSTMNAQTSHQSRQSLGTPLGALRSSPNTNSQLVSGTLSAEERQRFDSVGVGILSPSGQTVAAGLSSSPMISGALPAPAHLSDSQLSHREDLSESSLDRERTPSDLPDDVLLGSSDSDSEGHCEEEEEEEEEEEAHELDEDPSEEDIQLVPSDGLVETREPYKTDTALCPDSLGPVPTLARDTSNLSEASRAAAHFEAQRVTIREIPNYNDSDDPIEDSESELEMLRRASSARKTRGSGARGARTRGTRRRGR